MIFLSLLVLAISGKLCCAQNATDILALFPEVSDFSALVNSYPRFLSKLQAANNFTLLVPNNTALSQWRAGQIFAIENSENITQDYIEATLSYHLLNGTYPTADFGIQPQFISTGLLNQSWNLVTGGQRVEVAKNGTLTFTSGINTISHFLFGDVLLGDIGTNGIVHVIDTVLEVPGDVVNTAELLSWSYFLSIAQHWSSWPSYNDSLVNSTSYGPDQTYFVPNSASALASTLNASLETQQNFGELLGYHILSGTVAFSTSLTNGSQFTTLSGLPIVVTVLDDGTIYINSAKVLSSDYIVSNGVMHVIDNVLIPGNTSGPVIPSSASHSSVSSSTNLPSTTSTPAKAPTTATRKLSTPVYAGIGVGALSFLVLLAILSVLLIKKYKGKNSAKLDNSHEVNSDIPEMTSGQIHETPQLETHERLVELPSPPVPRMTRSERMGVLRFG